MSGDIQTARYWPLVDPDPVVSLFMKSFACQWCDETFERPDGPGRPPKYCCPSHRQQAHQAKKQTAEATRVLAEVDAAVALLPTELFTLGAVHEAIAFAMPGADALEGLQERVAAFGMSGLDELEGLQERVAAFGMSGLDELEGLQKDLATGAMLDLGDFASLQEELRAVIPTALGGLVIPDGFLGRAETAATLIDAAGLADDFRSVATKLVLQFETSQTEGHLASSNLPPVVESVDPTSALGGLVAPDTDESSAWFILALAVLVAYPTSTAVLAQAISDLVFWLRVLSIATNSEPALGGALLVANVALQVTSRWRRAQSMSPDGGASGT